MSDVPKSIQFVPTEPIIRAFERYGHEREFNDFIKALEDRAVTVAIMALAQRDDFLNRQLGGRGAELLEIVGAFHERRVLRETEEYLGQPIPDDPLRGVEP